MGLFFQNDVDGKDAAEPFARKGWNVVATMQSPEKEQKELSKVENVLITRPDVQDPGSIEKALRAKHIGSKDTNTP
jgi:NAD(P)-dependent dehydrogenase (short-subunit alcohol dehydrogenase family)